MESYREGSSVDPWIDRLVADRYRLVEKLGAGSAGRVYKAVEVASSLVVAVKILEPDPAALGPLAALRFEEKVAAVQSLEHPNLVRILDHGSAGSGAGYLVMEYFEGRTLEEALQREEELPPRRQARIALQLARALSIAHAQGLVHRDLKPSNILLVEDPGPPGEVRLLDFGIAGRSGIGLSDLDGGFLGSPAYMAPGQARGDAPDPRDDVYSLGVVAYEMACGRPPFEADSSIGVMLMHQDEAPKPPRMIDRDVPPLLERAILRALSKDRGDRFQSMEEWIDVLEEIVAQLDDAPAHPSTLGSRSRLRPWWLLLFAAAALFTLRVLAR